MNLIELFLIAVGLSMDTFAVSVSIGMTMAKASVKNAVTTGLIFGIAQAGMPVLGYVAASWFAGWISAFDHWVVFIIIFSLGVKMIVGSFKKEKCRDRQCPDQPCDDRACPAVRRGVSSTQMLILALSTSVDALAVGISFAVLQTGIVRPITVIGVTTLVFSMLGVKVGNVFGTKFKSKAELAGGIILVLIALNVLREHLGLF